MHPPAPRCSWWAAGRFKKAPSGIKFSTKKIVPPFSIGFSTKKSINPLKTINIGFTAYFFQIWLSAKIPQIFFSSNLLLSHHSMFTPYYLMLFSCCSHVLLHSCSTLAPIPEYEISMRKNGARIAQEMSKNWAKTEQKLSMDFAENHIS